MDLPPHLAAMDGWVKIEGLGWLRQVEAPGGGVDFWWWHHCPPLLDQARWAGPRLIDTSTGERHEIVHGSLAGGDLTIHGGSGSIPCDRCGLHGWVRNGCWVPA